MFSILKLMPTQKFADILLPVKLDKKYTYLIPKQITNKIQNGTRVIVNFGKTKLYTGIVIDIHKNIPNKDIEVKEILEAVDNQPIVIKKQFALWKWIKNYYCATNGEILRAAIPSNLIPSSESIFSLCANNDVQQDLTETEEKIIDYLKTVKNTKLNSIANAVNLKNPLLQLQQLEKKGLILVNQKIEKRYKPQLKPYVKFDKENLKTQISEYEKLSKKGNKQKAILDFLIEDEQKVNHSIIVEVKELLLRFNTSLPVLKKLEEKKLINIFYKEISRFDFENIEQQRDLSLSEAQQNAYNSITEGFKNNKTVLLHGVTSSGKTEIYIKLIKEAIKKGKQVLYMLPEIALTAQTIQRLRKYFGDKVGVYHSKYSLNNRSEVYKKLLNKEIDIILGVRSSLFLPFENLGLIVVDEEHENSYKQQTPNPRYNARDTAVVLSNIHNANIVLGSATPSVESYYNCKIGKYQLVELSERYGNAQLPDLQIVDIKDAYRRKIMKHHFHPVLYRAIEETLKNKEQIVLFQNRRGYSPFLECKDCAWVPHCENCNVSLTFHKFKNLLECHYCGNSKNVYHTCKYCGSDKLSTKGLGTERIVDEIKTLFPEANVDRLDQDSASSRKRFEKIIKDFETHKTDILVGTQMITKGLDFENLTLVGILNADNMLNFPDFRAFERAFQLLLQVSGRSGRRHKKGKVIIQTYNPEHKILQQVIRHDYKDMFDNQISERELFKYPPYWNFIIIKLKNKDKTKLYQTAKILSEVLRKELHQRVKGPEEPVVNMINRYFILNIHVRIEKAISSSKIKTLILENIKNIKQEPYALSTEFEIDVDPA